MVVDNFFFVRVITEFAFNPRMHIAQRLFSFYSAKCVSKMTRIGFDGIKYSRHFSFVECDDITARSSRFFDKFIVQT